MTQVGRNDPCPCGSGKKYKKCCGLSKGPKKIQATLLSPSSSAMQGLSKSFFQGSPVEEGEEKDPS